MPIRVLLFIISSCIMLSGCGFQPLYATPKDGSAAPLLRQINVATIVSTRDAGEGNLAVQPILREALENRLLVSQQTNQAYDLIIEVTPRARRLGVQTDASVARFNYQLFSRYRLVHRETGAFINGSPSSIASFNQVTAQYSSLFSERTAVVKASERLAEEIERDILLQRDKIANRIQRARQDGAKPVDVMPEFELPAEDKEFDPDFDPELIPSR